MRTRVLALAAVVVALLGVASFWAVKERREATGDEAKALQRVGAPRVPLAARIVAILPEPGSPAVVTVRIFNHIARQAAATNTALEAAASPVPRLPLSPVTISLAPDAWAGAVRFESPAGASVPPSSVRVLGRPDAASHVLGASDVIHALFEIGSDGVRALDGQIVAVVSVNGWTIRSNVFTLAPPQQTRDRLIARARAAELRGDHPALLAAGDALTAAAPGDPMGAWFRGLALEAQGKREDALAAYQAAASTVDPARMEEPPIELYRRIAALSGR